MSFACAALTVTQRTELDSSQLYSTNMTTVTTTTTVLCSGLRLIDANCIHDAAVSHIFPCHCKAVMYWMWNKLSLSLQRGLDEVILLWNRKAAFDPVAPRDSGVEEGRGFRCQWCHATRPKLSQGIALSESPWIFSTYSFFTLPHNKHLTFQDD